MRFVMASAAALAIVAVASTSAIAAPVKLSKAQMDQIAAGSSANFPPGQFPAGNPAKAPGKSNPNQNPNK